MVSETMGKDLGPGIDMPAAVYRRQAWRPRALQGAESLLSGIARRNEPLDRRRARLTAWYERLVRRGQPFIGWQPLTTEDFGGENTQPSDIVQPRARTARREPQMIPNAPPPDMNVSDSLVRP